MRSESHETDPASPAVCCQSPQLHGHLAQWQVQAQEHDGPPRLCEWRGLWCGVPAPGRRLPLFPVHVLPLAHQRHGLPSLSSHLRLSWLGGGGGRPGGGRDLLETSRQEERPHWHLPRQEVRPLLSRSELVMLIFVVSGRRLVVTTTSPVLPTWAVWPDTVGTLTTWRPWPVSPALTTTSVRISSSARTAASISRVALRKYHGETSPRPGARNAVTTPGLPSHCPLMTSQWNKSKRSGLFSS